MPSAQGFHGENADPCRVGPGNGSLHGLAGTVGNAHAGAVNQRMNDVHPGITRRVVHRRHTVRGKTHRKNLSPGLLLQIKVEGLPVPLQGQAILLLVHEKNRNNVHVQAAAGVVKGLLRRFPVPGIGLGGYQQIGPPFQRKAQRLVGIIQLGRIKQIDPSFSSIKHQLRAALGRKALLHGADGQRAEGQREHIQAAVAQRPQGHHLAVCPSR